MSPLSDFDEHCWLWGGCYHDCCPHDDDYNDDCAPLAESQS